MRFFSRVLGLPGISSLRKRKGKERKGKERKGKKKKKRKKRIQHPTTSKDTAKLKRNYIHFSRVPKAQFTGTKD